MLLELKDFKKLHVDRDCKLRDFVEKRKLAFKRGHAFYQFVEVENVSEDKVVIFMNEVMFTDFLYCLLAIYISKKPSCGSI